MERQIFLWVLLLPICLWSQDTHLKGQIIDDSTGKAIPFSTVIIKGKGIGAATGLDGVFDLSFPKYSKSDSLKFSALGYKSYCVLLSEFLASTKSLDAVQVKLVPISYQLTEIEVLPTKAEEIFGTLAETTSGAAYNFYAGAQVFIFIPNEKAQKGIIKSASYFFTDKRKKPTAPFRVKVLSANQDGLPATDMLLESVVVSAPKEDQWFTVNLEKYNLPIPANGYFIGLELIYTDKKYQFKGKGRLPGLDPKRKFQGPSLGMSKAVPPSYTWQGQLGRKWRNYSYVDGNGYTYNYMIQSTVKWIE